MNTLCKLVSWLPTSDMGDLVARSWSVVKNHAMYKPMMFSSLLSDTPLVYKSLLAFVYLIFLILILH